jgi:hypothetical protein
MKKEFAFIILLFFFFSVMGMPGCKPKNGGSEIYDSLPEAPGYLTAIDEDLYTAKENGTKLLLKGVNAGGWLITEDWMCPTGEDSMYELWDGLAAELGEEKAEELLNFYRDNWWTEEDFDNCKAAGCNVIRLPFGWRDLEYNDCTPRENGFSRLDWFIAECAKRQIYVILDLHAAHGSQNGQHHSGDCRTGGDLYGNEENMARTEALWIRIAEHYKENKWVAGYDLLNEPEGKIGGSMNLFTPHWSYYDRLYDAIRKIDPDHLIFMEAVWEKNNLPPPDLFGWKNVCYEMHFYLWGDNSQNLEAQKTFLDQKLIFDSLITHVPVLIGEFTFFNNPDSWRYGLNFFNEQGWSWTMWTYKVYGTGSSWGLYTGPNPDADTQVKAYDPEETIIAKWGALKTSKTFIPNTWLIEIIKEACAV